MSPVFFSSYFGSNTQPFYIFIFLSLEKAYVIKYLQKHSDLKRLYAIVRVGQAIGQVEHVHFLVCDPSQGLVDVFVEDHMAGGAGQSSFTRSWNKQNKNTL